MPYRKRFYKKASGKPTAKNAMKLAKKAIRAVAEVKELNGLNIDGSVTLVTNNTPIFTAIDYPATLDGSFDQYLKTLEFSYKVDDAGAGIVRCMLVHDTMPTGTMPTAMDMFSTNTPSMTTLLDFDQNDRFKIWHDLVSRPNDVTTPALGTNTFPVHKVVKHFKHFKVESKTKDTFTYANIEKGSLFFLMYSDNLTTVPAIIYSVQPICTN